MRDDVNYVPRRLQVHPSTKFADTLRKEIADGTWAPGTVRRSGELRRRFGTTPHVISKTVQLLRDESLVGTRPGGGGGITPSGTTLSTWQQRVCKDDIEDAVRRRISDGTHPVGKPFPSVAVLSKEFGVARSMISLALKPLKDQGFLTNAGATARDGTVVAQRIPSDACPQPDADHADTDCDQGPDVDRERGADRV
ncbi:DNA-binding GntR family transcriptional regulator [Streptomyces umbrinus]|uniref:DNA-binding GntR family transcriptional regulator n=1 Tax=Streptomyces umbrinus TaxID=67370 RepID=A0ABU0T719_9ACTN|nr:GntR family transcriptional regulator [Streptomyces umbrinus]MDQ1031478.1 DNA-binding GntR family transcriptional regulator [Streptomyces umbrinus]